jgi:hydroxymethylglutaryl-CoA lyase
MLSNFQRIYNIPITLKRIINKPILFDVSLRDGIQGIPKHRQESISLNDKIDVFHSILFNYSPKKLEIGSIVNPKIMPIMADSLKLHKYAEGYIKKSLNLHPELELFIVVPNKKAFDIGFNNGVKNFSFLTSVSNSFQMKNVNKSIHETKRDLEEISKSINSQPDNVCKTKLYISCINNCPLEGIIDNDVIVNEILTYHKMFPSFNEYCLSDTCGTLKFEDYKYIVDACIFFGMPSSKISLHLHVNKENYEELKHIIFHSLDNNIIRFDVSMLETGGCPMTLPSSKMLPNLSYEVFNKIYEKYEDVRSNSV